MGPGSPKIGIVSSARDKVKLAILDCYNNKSASCKSPKTYTLKQGQGAVTGTKPPSTFLKTKQVFDNQVPLDSVSENIDFYRFILNLKQRHRLPKGW